MPLRAAHTQSVAARSGWHADRFTRWQRALGYLALFGGVWFVAIPGCLVLMGARRRLPRPRSRAPVTLGSATFTLGAVLSFWAARDLIERGQGTPFPLDPTRVLVTDGLYGWVRNPQAIATLLMAIGESAVLQIPYSAGYLLLTLAYLELAARPVEDWQLSRAFGDEYIEYRAAVRRWWPRGCALRRRATAGGSQHRSDKAIP